MPLPPNDVTSLLIEWRQGDPHALDRLMPLVYGELRRLAGRYMRRERSDHSFDPTELVHEAYLKLSGKNHPRWRDRIHFYAVAAQLMRRILVDHARGHRTAKRGGGVPKLSLQEAGEVSDQEATDLVALDEALKDLAEIDQRKARIIELRFFGGLTIEETAEFLEVSTATVIADTRLARAWLHKEMQAAEAAAESAPQRGESGDEGPPPGPA
ncbi:MAG: sigma-70 family RNA polymerase sigma factor [Acidobacteriota bacterium]